jgi:hypothetical protein
MDTNELELLKKVLPEGFTVTTRADGPWTAEIRDVEGEELVRVRSTTARGALIEVMAEYHQRGAREGRSAQQREVLKALGLDDTLHGIIVNANEMESDLRQLTRTVEGLVKKG